MTAFVFFLMTTPALGQKMGLKSITKRELLIMQSELGMRRIKEVRPNLIGFKRANEERKKRGFPLLSSPVRANGKETLVDQELNDFLGGALPGGGDFFAGILPAARCVCHEDIQCRFLHNDFDSDRSSGSFELKVCDDYQSNFNDIS
jgi:hypothetical protein